MGYAVGHATRGGHSPRPGRLPTPSPPRRTAAQTRRSPAKCDPRFGRTFRGLLRRVSKGRLLGKVSGKVAAKWDWERKPWTQRHGNTFCAERTACPQTDGCSSQTGAHAGPLALRSSLSRHLPATVPFVSSFSVWRPQSSVGFEIGQRTCKEASRVPARRRERPTSSPSGCAASGRPAGALARRCTRTATPAIHTAASGRWRPGSTARTPLRPGAHCGEAAIAVIAVIGLARRGRQVLRVCTGRPPMRDTVGVFASAVRAGMRSTCGAWRGS